MQNLDKVSKKTCAKKQVYTEKLSNKSNKEYRMLEESTIVTEKSELSNEVSIIAVEQPPTFISENLQNIEEFINKNIKYPDVEQKTEGIVYVSFIIRKNGQITKPKIEKSIGKKYDEEALRLANLTNGKWKAGQEHEKAVRVKYVLPIKFK